MLAVLVLLVAVCCLLPAFAETFENGDMNGDGQLNKDDAIYLLRHVVFPDKYPLNN